MGKSFFLLALLSCLPGSAQTLSSRLPPWMQPVTVTSHNTNEASTELEALLSRIENALERRSTHPVSAEGTSEFMTIAQPIGGDETTTQIDETEVAGPASILANNLGVVAGQNLGISLGQNFAVPTFQRTGIGPHHPDEHNPGFVLAEPHQDAVTQLRSLRRSLQLFLVVQREFQRILPMIARISTILEKEPAPLWASLAPDAGNAHVFSPQRQK